MGTAKPAADKFAQGAGRLAVDRAVGQQVTADQGALQAYLRWPHLAGQGTAHTLTYRNEGTAPATLDLGVRAARQGGGAAPGGLFTLSATRVTVPARGQASVRLTVRTGCFRRGGR